MKRLIEYKRHVPVIFIFILGLVPLLWFFNKGNVLINGVDTNFPLNPLLWFQRRFFVWNNIVNTGQDFSSGTSGMFFHLIQTIPFLLGFSLHFAELISLLFWFSLITLSSYLLSKLLFPKNNWARLTLVILYTFNIYLFNTWENVKVSNLSLYVALPLVFWILFSLSYRLFSFRKGFLYLVGLAVIASGTGINPAYFSILILAIVLFGVIFGLGHLKDGRAKSVVTASFLALAVVIGVNLFWILPLAHHLISQGVSELSGIGYADWLNSLSKDTSLVNVMRLQGAWDWYVQDSYGMPIYLPYTLNYFYKLPFIVFSFIPPVLAFVSLIFINKGKKDWYLFAAVLMLLGIFFGCGSHPPTGSLYLYLSKHLPMFSFFRSPWYIFTPLLTVSYSILIGLLVERATLFFKGKLQLLLKFVFLVFWVSYFLYNYPLITGKIFRPGRDDSYFVKFPDYLWQARDYLVKKSQSSDLGRIITYPDDQLETFTWGYRGTDSILGLFSDVEFVSPSFTAESESSTKILDTFYEKIKDSEYETAKGLLPFLGVNTIFVKRDVTTNSHIPEELISESQDKSIIGKWVFINGNNLTAKIFSPHYLYADYSNFEAMLGASSALPFKSVVVTSLGDKEVEKVNLKESSLYLNQALPLEINDLSTNQNKNFTFEISQRGTYKIYIEKRGLEPKQIALKLDSNMLSEYQNFDDYIIFVIYNLYKGKHTLNIKFPPTGDQLIKNDLSSQLFQGDLRSEDLPSDKLNTITVYNSGTDDKNISFNVRDFSTKYSYLLEFDYKYFYGNSPVIDFVQFSSRSFISDNIEKLDNSLDWKHMSFLFNPFKIDSELQVNLKVPGSASGDSSKTFIENIVLERVYDNQVFILAQEQKPLNAPDLVFHKISPVKYSIEVPKSNSEGYIIAFLEKYSRDWKLSSQDSILKGVYFPHFMINGYANAWYIPKGKDGQVFILYYRPQMLFNLGMTLSVLIILLSTGVNLYARFRPKK